MTQKIIQLTSPVFCLRADAVSCGDIIRSAIDTAASEPSLFEGMQKDTHILVVGHGFGTGPEAGQAAERISGLGIRALIAASLPAPFYDACIRNGLLPVQLPPVILEEIFEWVEGRPCA